MVWSVSFCGPYCLEVRCLNRHYGMVKFIDMEGNFVSVEVFILFANLIFAVLC